MDNSMAHVILDIARWNGSEFVIYVADHLYPQAPDKVIRLPKSDVVTIVEVGDGGEFLVPYHIALKHGLLSSTATS
jgi:hypothetical protein